MASASVFTLASHDTADRGARSQQDRVFGFIQPSLLALPAAVVDSAIEQGADADGAAPASSQRASRPGPGRAAYRKLNISPHSSVWRFESIAPQASVRAVFERMKGSSAHSATDVTQLVETLDYCERGWRPLRNELVFERERIERGEASSMDLAAMADAVAQGNSACQDIPEEAYRLQDDWLTEAAAAGDEKAQFLYASGRLHLWRDQINLMRWPEEVMVYKTQARAYLESLARQGHEDSLLALADSYEGGTLTEMDPMQAFIYRSAATRAQRGPDADGKLHELWIKLPPERREEASRLANSLFQDCCAPRSLGRRERGPRRGESR